MAMLHDAQGQPAACLMVAEESQPTDQGTLIYLSVSGRIQEAAAATKANGGEILKEIHQIGPYGYRAIIKDPEGNRIALHSETEA